MSDPMRRARGQRKAGDDGSRSGVSITLARAGARRMKIVAAPKPSSWRRSFPALPALV